MSGRIPRSTRPSSAPGNLSHLMRTGSHAQPLLVMTTLIPRIPIPPRCSRFLLEARNRANAPSGTAIRSARSTLPSIQRTPRSPVAVLIYSTPAASVRTNQHFKALLSSAAGKPDSPSTHTPPPAKPRLLTEPAEKPSSAPGPKRNASGGNYGNAAGGADSCCFPRLGFPPLEPPFPRRPLSKGNPPGEETHPGFAAAKAGGTQHGSLLFYSRRPAQ